MTTSGQLPFEATIHVRDHCLCLHTQRAARALARRFDNALKPLGITNGQFSLLMSLNRHQPPTLGSVATLLAMDRTTLTANLKPLEKRGLIKTIADPKDKRARLLALTTKGNDVLLQAMPVWQESHAEIEKGLQNPSHLRQELNALSALKD